MFSLHKYSVLIEFEATIFLPKTWRNDFGESPFPRPKNELLDFLSGNGYEFGKLTLLNENVRKKMGNVTLKGNKYHVKGSLLLTTKDTIRSKQSAKYLVNSEANNLLKSLAYSPFTSIKVSNVNCEERPYNYI